MVEVIHKVTEIILYTPSIIDIDKKNGLIANIEKPKHVEVLINKGAVQGKDGVTYTPSLTNGVLSWTVNSDTLEVPPSINLYGIVDRISNSEIFDMMEN